MKTSILRAALWTACLATAPALWAAPGSLGFSSTTASVNEAAGTATLNVERTVDTGGSISVNYSFSGGSPAATNGSDYTGTSGTLTWGTGVGGVQSITVPITNDSILESDERFVVTLSNPTGGASLTASTAATVTIVDDEISVSLVANSATVNEGAGNVQLQVTRSGNLSQAAWLSYSTTAGSATAGTDFASATNGTLNFAAGEGTATIIVPIIEDTVAEGSENFTVTITNPGVSGSGTALLGAITSATVTITDNDGALAITATDPAATPVFGSTFTLAATFTGATSGTPFSYAWTRDGVSIIDGGRYSLSTSNPTGNTTRVALTITDANASDNGAYNLVISNGAGASVSFATTVTVTQAEATRDPNTHALGIGAGSSNKANALLHLPDGRTLAAVTGLISGSSATSVAAGANLVVINIDGSVALTGAGVFNNTVSDLRLTSDGKILVLGSFTRVGGAEGAGRQRLARLNPDLTLDTTFLPSPLPSFLNGTGPDRLLVDFQGRILLGGNFSSYGGIAGYDTLVRLFEDGALDRGFTRAPAAGGDVNALLLQTDGKVIVAGDFDSLRGDNLPVRSIYRLNADDTVDTDFTTPAFIGSLAFETAALDSEGNIYLSQFNPDHRLYRLLSTGALDSDFPFNLNSYKANDYIRTLLPTSDGKLLVGGEFTTVTIAGASTALPRLFRLNADGTRDTGFSVGTALNSNVSLVSRAAGGRIWLSGAFTSYSGSTASRLLVLEGVAPELAFSAAPQGQAALAGGTATFKAAATGDNGFTYAWFKDGDPLADGAGISGSATATLTLTNIDENDGGLYTVEVTSPTESIESISSVAPLTVITDPVIVVAPESVVGPIYGSVTLSVVGRGPSLGYQWYFEGDPLPGANSAELVLTGLNASKAGYYSVTVSNSFGDDPSDSVLVSVERDPGARALDVASISFNGEVFAILPLADGSTLVGGSFTTVSVNGATAQSRGRIARFLSDGTLDGSFNPTVNSAVRALAQDSLGRIYVGGDFGSVNFGSGGVSRQRVFRMTSALALDTGFVATAETNGLVYSLAPVGDGSVYIGGTFTQIGGASANYVALLASNGSLSGGFISGATAAVNALVYDDGVLYAGGKSDTWTTGVGSARLVKLSADGTRQAFTSPTAVIVNSLRLLADGTLMVGGSASETNDSISYIARVDANAGSPVSSPVYEAEGHSGPVYSIAEQADGKILSSSYGRFLRTDLTGEADADFGVFGNSAIRTVAVDSAQRIWVGGAFGTYDGSAAGNIVVLNGGEADLDLGDREAQTITFPEIAGGPYNPAAPTVPLLAVSDSGLPVSYALVGTAPPATLHGSTLIITGAGTVTVRASQAGDTNYAPAASVTRSFTVTKLEQEISFDPISNRRTTAPDFEITASTTAEDLDLIFEISGPATLEGTTVSLTGGAGTVTIKATQPGNAIYTAALPVVRSFEVEAIPLTPLAINFPQPAARTFGSAAAPIVATTTVKGVAPSFEVVAEGTTLFDDEPIAEFAEDGRTLILRGAGEVVIRAYRDSDGIHEVPAPIVRTLVVNKAAQRINFTLPTNLVLGNEPPAVAATSTLASGAATGLTVSFEINEAKSTPGVATLSEENELTVDLAGRIVIVATQEGDANYLAAKPITRTLTVKGPTLRFDRASLIQTYTGEPLSVIVTGAPEGFTPEVTYRLGKGEPTTDAPTTAGTYRVSASIGTAVANATFTIRKALLTVTPEPVTVKVGTIIPTSGTAAQEFFPLTYSGFVNDEDESVLDPDTLPQPRANATFRSSQGQYTITASKGLDDNYQYVYGRGTLTLVGLAGTYEALIIDNDPESGIPIGHLTLTMASNSYGYSGKLVLADEAKPVVLKSGSPSLVVNPVLSANEAGTVATGEWTRAATSSLSALSLTLTVNSDGYLVGTLSRDGAAVATLVNGRRLRSERTGAAGAGSYTMTFDPTEEGETIPEGVGYATGRMTGGGGLTLRGKLPDGTNLSASATMDIDGTFRVFTKPYGTRSGNRFGGFLPLAPVSEGSSLYGAETGGFVVIKPSAGASADASFRDGFTTALDTVIATWRAPATSPSVITLANLLGLTEAASETSPVGIDFINALLSEDQLLTLPESRTLLTNNTLQNAAENPSAFKLVFTRSTWGSGAFNGTFRLVIPPSTSIRTIGFNGVLIQPAAGYPATGLVARGLFVLPSGTRGEPATTGEIQFISPLAEP